MGISIKQYDNCGHSPAWPFVVSAMLELQAKGFAGRPHVAPAYNDACLVAFGDDGSAVGFMIYRYDDVRSVWFIMLSYVAQKHRRKGIHSSLFDALVCRAKKRGDILSINCATHIDNIVAQAAFERQGRTKEAITYSFNVKEWVEGRDPLEVKGE